MSEEAPAVEPGEAPEVEPQGEPDATDWKAEARKWEARAKDNKAAAEELEHLRESQKTEEQKRAERESERERKLAAYELRDQVAAWSAEIVKDSHIPAAALRGSTQEELVEHFKELSALIPAPTTDTEPEPAPERKGAWAPFDRDEGKSPANASASGDWLRTAIS